MSCPDYADPMQYTRLTEEDWRRITADTIDRMEDLLRYPAVLLLPQDAIDHLTAALQQLQQRQRGTAAVG